MSKVAVIYWSGSGNTEAMARFVLEGALNAGAAADLFDAEHAPGDAIGGYDAVALGCPSMGAEQLEESVFEPMFEGLKPSLSGKKVALFGSYGWGDGEWMRTWEEDCAATGITLATPSVICNEAPDETAAAACRALGQAIAQ